MNLIVFEDAAVTQLYPITAGRPAYAISCASYRLMDWLPRVGQTLTAIVRPHLRTTQLVDLPHLHSRLDPRNRWTLVVNARLVPGVTTYRELCRLSHRDSAAVVRDGWALAAALLPTDMFGDKTDMLGDKNETAILGELERLTAGKSLDGLEVVDAPLKLLQYPHDIVRENLACFAENLEHRLQHGDWREVADGVFTADQAVIGAHVVTDTSRGPILLDQGAQIGAYTYLRGPAYVGCRSRVIEHSAIKDAVSLGHTTKIGGEVEASVIEPYTNKQHHGFLGHSYLGSWINLGAGTCNSDLKNTYGEVKMDYRGQRVSTGMQFIGCIVGDYAKTAINTGIFTGKTIGVCSMVCGFVTTNVPSFVNYARSFGQVTELPPSVMVATQNRMFQRRQVEQRPCDVQLLHDMFELTRFERQLAEEPLVL